MALEVSLADNIYEHERAEAAKYLQETAQNIATAATQGTRNIETWGMFAWSVLAVAETSDPKQTTRTQLATIASRAISEVLPTDTVEASATGFNIKLLLAISRIALSRTEPTTANLSSRSKSTPYLDLLGKFSRGEVRFAVDSTAIGRN